MRRDGPRFGLPWIAPEAANDSKELAAPVDVSSGRTRALSRTRSTASPGPTNPMSHSIIRVVQIQATADGGLGVDSDVLGFKFISVSDAGLESHVNT